MPCYSTLLYSMHMAVYIDCTVSKIVPWKEIPLCLHPLQLSPSFRVLFTVKLFSVIRFSEFRFFFINFNLFISICSYLGQVVAHITYSPVVFNLRTLYINGDILRNFVRSYYLLVLYAFMSDTQVYQCF